MSREEILMLIEIMEEEAKKTRAGVKNMNDFYYLRGREDALNDLLAKIKSLGIAE